jgi:cysteine-rich secretory family protein
MRRVFIAVAFAGICILLPTPALTLDLNSFRAQHRLPPLAASEALANAAYSHARSLATRQARPCRLPAARAADLRHGG